jgi:hypothetical protein
VSPHDPQATCDAIQETLTERLLRRAGPAPIEPEPAERAHVEACAACGAHLRFLRALGATLAHDAPPPPAPEIVARSRERATRALRAHRAAPPRGFGRELAVSLAVLALALPVALGHAWLVAEGAARLLGPLLPHAVLLGLGVVYFGSLALAVGTLYALVPLWVATLRRARMEAS